MTEPEDDEDLVTFDEIMEDIKKLAKSSVSRSHMSGSGTSERQENYIGNLTTSRL